jgi:hypothetical protein
VTDQVSHAYKTTDKITVLYNLRFYRRDGKTGNSVQNKLHPIVLYCSVSRITLENLDAPMDWECSQGTHRKLWRGKILHNVHMDERKSDGTIILRGLKWVRILQVQNLWVLLTNSVSTLLSAVTLFWCCGMNMTLL